MRTPLSSSCQLGLGVVLRHLGLSPYKQYKTNIKAQVSLVCLRFKSRSTNS